MHVRMCALVLVRKPETPCLDQGDFDAVHLRLVTASSYHLDKLDSRSQVF